MVEERPHIHKAPQRVALFGAKGGAEVVAEYLVQDSPRYQTVGYLNDYLPKGTIVNGVSVLGRFDEWEQLPEDVFFNAPLHKAKEMGSRSARIDGLGIPARRWLTITHPKANTARSVEIAVGTSLGPYCEIQPRVRIGRHVAIRGTAFIGHDVTIGDFCFLGAGSMVAGYVHIERGAHIGPNAAIRESVRIGRFAVVGIGAVVVRDVGDYEIVAGNPARNLGWTDFERHKT
jgi:sugar O-acyltransferase (sialic acid O-acetyltransferase NeuD family)